MSWSRSTGPSPRSKRSGPRSATTWSTPRSARCGIGGCAILARQDGEQRKLVTVVFSDLVDFTVLSQALDAEDVRTIVNRLLPALAHESSRRTAAWSRSSSVTP